MDKFWLLLLELDCLAAMLFFWEGERDDTQAVTSEPKSEKPLGPLFSKLTSFFPVLRFMIQWRIPARMIPKVSLQTQFLLKQGWNLSVLLLRICWLAIASIILIALGIIVALFRPSRFLINLFFEQAYLLPLIWIGIVLADQVTDFLIDYSLNRWAEERQEADPKSTRLGRLRVEKTRIGCLSWGIWTKKFICVMFTQIGFFFVPSPISRQASTPP